MKVFNKGLNNSFKVFAVKKKLELKFHTFCISQNVILHTVEDDNDSDKRVTNNDSSTMVAAGVGLTFGGLTIDGMLSAGTLGTTQGNLDGNNVLTRIGANYSF